jgi:hypothetical protein
MEVILASVLCDQQNRYGNPAPSRHVAKQQRSWPAGLRGRILQLGRGFRRSMSGTGRAGTKAAVGGASR